MKKVLVIIGLLALLLVGCSDANASISSGNDVILKVGDEVITKEDLYNQMLTSDEAATVVNQALAIILNKEIATTDELKETAQKEYDEYLEDLGEDYEDHLYQLGCKTTDELFQLCLNNAKHDALYVKEINANFDSLVSEYAPFKAKILFFDGSSDSATALLHAQEALTLIKDGATFEEMQEKYSTTKDLITEKLYVATDSSLDYNVLTWINGQSTPGTSDVITNKAGTGYYIVRITNKNAEQVKDDFISYLTSYETYTKSVDTKYFKAHGFTIFDKNTYDFIKENYSQYLVQ